MILNLFVAVLYTLFNDEGEDEVIPHKELAEEDDADTPPDTKKVPALVATVSASLLALCSPLSIPNSQVITPVLIWVQLRAIRGLRRKPASSLSASKSFKRVHAPETQGLLQKMRHFFSNHASWKGAVEVPLEEMEGKKAPGTHCRAPRYTGKVCSVRLNICCECRNIILDLAPDLPLPLFRL